MYIYYSIGNNSGPRTLVRTVEVSVIGGVHFRRFHCIILNANQRKKTGEAWERGYQGVY